MRCFLAGGIIIKKLDLIIKRQKDILEKLDNIEKSLSVQNKKSKSENPLKSVKSIPLSEGFFKWSG